jgi:hypothetical protein
VVAYADDSGMLMILALLMFGGTCYICQSVAPFIFVLALYVLGPEQLENRETCFT